jgi:NADH:ubiquinone oxidoreductase subunit B-like Fe-S oxidoreductase
VLALTEIEQQRYDSAPRRREVRLILSGRMKPEQSTEIRSFFDDMPRPQ